MTQKLRLTLLVLVFRYSILDAAFSAEQFDQPSDTSRSKLMDCSEHQVSTIWTEKDKSQLKQLWAGASKTSPVLKRIHNELLQAEYTRDRIKQIFAESLNLATSVPMRNETNKKVPGVNKHKTSVSKALITTNSFDRVRSACTSLTEPNLEPDYPVPGGQAAAYLLPYRQMQIQPAVGLSYDSAIERPLPGHSNPSKTELQMLAKNFASSFQGYKKCIILGKRLR
ncbi:MAG: hypothetical protein K2X81_24500, partial [Candidatus Obscuribacterales bacterium]|nr:hypothetical protein [Candidatus Obscuribacterales bacterium]